MGPREDEQAQELRRQVAWPQPFTSGKSWHSCVEM